eukprot:TRINITY_DN32587_c0_g1_i1.p1 TRINITY_DN32587_c0_g1~~TRINITY_DN32587_c0_g1_i1.p1  ORF type:complete len:299 (-),score=57.04 TRINITY_DN32587_c0_g1_i1:139-1035(-)
MGTRACCSSDGLCAREEEGAPEEEKHGAGYGVDAGASSPDAEEIHQSPDLCLPAAARDVGSRDPDAEGDLGAHAAEATSSSPLVLGAAGAAARGGVPETVGEAEVGTESEHRWSEASSPACAPTAPTDFSVLSTASTGGGERPVQELASSSALGAPSEYSTACCNMGFSCNHGPNGLGLLIVSFKPVSVTSATFGKALESLVLLTRDHIHSDFATIFDISRMSVPSPFTLPSLLAVFKEHSSKLEIWREHQQAFAVVKADNALLNVIVSAFSALSRAKTKPVIARDQAEAKKLLATVI